MIGWSAAGSRAAAGDASAPPGPLSVFPNAAGSTSAAATMSRTPGRAASQKEVRPVFSCNDCPERSTCKSICPKVEKLLPPEDGRQRADLHPLDRSVAWRVQDYEHILSPRQRLVARLYHRMGLNHEEIAGVLGIQRPAVTKMLKRIRKKIPKHGTKTA